MVSSRLPRFQRAHNVAPLQLTERDYEIMRAVHRHRFLRSTQVVALVQDKAQPILRRLQLLYHHGYLERPRAQLDYYHQGGSRPIVYGLGNKGAACLKLETRSQRWGEKNRSLGRFFLEHALLVSDVMVALELACRDAGVRLLTEKDLLLKGVNSKWHVKLATGLRLGVVPDRIFALEQKEGSLERLYFFLEADRGTMPVRRRQLDQTSFYRKLLAYVATWTQSIHVKRFGFHRFRVLTVTTSAERVKTLVEACGELNRGQGLFLFADTSALNKSDVLFSATWRTGRKNVMGRMLGNEAAGLDERGRAGK